MLVEGSNPPLASQEKPETLKNQQLRAFLVYDEAYNAAKNDN